MRLLRAANGLSLAGQLFEVVTVLDDGYRKYLSRPSCERLSKSRCHGEHSP